MREQYITIENAKLAKEKGFDVVCDYVYDIVVNEENPIVIRNQSSLGNLSYFADRFIAAPTHSLLQKWLREVHQIYVAIDVDQTSSPKFCYAISRFIGNPTNLAAEEWDWENCPNGKNWSLHRKWEDALEDGLFEALKLI